MLRSTLLLTFLAATVGRGGCAPSPEYVPCEGKSCGDACTVCAPDDGDCVETAVMKACDPSGACVSGPADCGTWDPCAGKACGEYCDPCAPGEPCPLYFAATACDPEGKCVTAGTFTCKLPTDPCAGKLCGDACSTCDPLLGACPAVMMYCDAAGQCGYAFPVCKTPPP
jgi:hypothetical protein